MTKRKNIRIYRDKEGRNYLKESYFIGGKMKFRRIYLVDGIPADEFYEKNANEIDKVIDGNFHLIDNNSDLDNGSNELTSSRKEVDDLPF
ncbi:MAG: hypothetical protein K2X86_13975 [Cytophagaceae bacterium]|nr:hypothetical protein [Cytophagaceae bacterium]